ncbi:MAG: ABC transporter glutamine-binding protein GlnH [Paracidovorax wautersii]|uniref:ABC transporter glutamine-binding protein GlnH n=1 Tax=Paracidovorax wautersii TaxID=1177982 RepID=A0A7V8JPT0_9BURK|nr:MAG: ABC transporter glutamine-binding protein GlnH [Paracidovorax wautersii]
MTRLGKRHFSLALIAAALFGASAVAHAQNALADIQKSKTIKIAVPTDFPPYGFAGLDLQPQGLDVDMAKLIADKLGAKVELVPVTSANRIPYLQTKKADLVISTLGKNPEREKVIDFTHAYAPFYQGVFAPKTLTVKSFADLSGKTIAVTRGAMEDEELTKVGPADMTVKRFEDQAATTAAFAAGQTPGHRHQRLQRRHADPEEPAPGRRIQAAAQGKSQLHRRGQGRGRAARQGQRDHLGSQGRRLARKTLAEVAQARDRQPAAVTLHDAKAAAFAILPNLPSCPCPLNLISRPCSANGRCCSRAWPGRWG